MSWQKLTRRYCRFQKIKNVKDDSCQKLFKWSVHVSKCGTFDIPTGLYDEPKVLSNNLVSEFLARAIVFFFCFQNDRNKSVAPYQLERLLFQAARFHLPAGFTAVRLEGFRPLSLKKPFSLIFNPTFRSTRVIMTPAWISWKAWGTLMQTTGRCLKYSKFCQHWGVCIFHASKAYIWFWTYVEMKSQNMKTTNAQKAQAVAAPLAQNGLLSGDWKKTQIHGQPGHLRTRQENRIFSIYHGPHRIEKLKC